MIARVYAGAFLLLMSACAATPVTTDGVLVEADAGVPCNRLLIDAANYADDLAEHRTEQMMVMRFASEAAMADYVTQTRRIRLEALALGDLLMTLAERSGGTPDFTYRASANPTLEGATELFASAYACADEAGQ